MLTTVATVLFRVLNGFLRRADAGLARRNARTAVRNAACVIAETETHRLDVARTMRDLRRLRTTPT